MTPKQDKTNKDYKFTYEGNYDTEVFICTAKNADEAMKKFRKIYNGYTIFDVEIFPNK